MAYPFFSKAEARIYLTSLLNPTTEDEQQPALPDVHFSPEGPDCDWDAIAEDTRNALGQMVSALGETGKKAGSEFEIAAAPILHEALPEHPALADPEFWIWMAVAHGREIIRWRYGEDAKNLRNFGIGGAGENLFYRIWLRGEIAYNEDAEDRYRLVRSGDIDFWRSHIFRQGYGDARPFARALIEFQFPASRGGKPRLTISQIRDLAKHFKRARSNLMFEVMSESRATQFIEAEWDRLASETA